MIVLALVSRIDSITNFPDEFKTAIDTVSLCTSIPIYLMLSIQGAPFGRVEANTQNLLQRSALLYCVGDPLLRLTLDWTDHERREAAMLAKVELSIAKAMGA